MTRKVWMALVVLAILALISGWAGQDYQAQQSAAVAAQLVTQ